MSALRSQLTEHASCDNQYGVTYQYKTISDWPARTGMQLTDYADTQPLPEFAKKYASEVWAAAGNVAYEDFAYGADPYQRVALVRPAVPCGIILAFFHGGGWTSGYKEWNLCMAAGLVGRGITFASIGYRLAPRVCFPENLNDCAAGVASLWRKLTKDAPNSPNHPQLFIGGHSAGGHLASLLALQREWLAEQEMPADAIRGCLPVSGVYLFGSDSGLATRPQFLGAHTGTEMERRASPLHQIGSPQSGSTPPFHISWGSRDFPHLMVQARQFDDKLSQAGVNTSTLILDGCDHLGAHLATADVNGTWIGHATDWMRTTIR